MSIKILIGAFAAATLTLPVASAETTPTLDGAWFGTSNSPTEAHCWISRRKTDGTYRTDFITQDGAVYRKYWQEGLWNSANGVLTTVVKSESGKDVPARSLSYGIVSLTTEQLVYSHIASGTRFSVRRVSGDFQLPEKCAKVDA